MDDYVNTKTLQLLSQKQAGVEVVLFTENGHGKIGFLTTAVVNDFIQEYPPLRNNLIADCHARLIVLDYGLATEQAYHCGAFSANAYDCSQESCNRDDQLQRGRKRFKGGGAITTEHVQNNTSEED